MEEAGQDRERTRRQGRRPRPVLWLTVLLALGACGLFAWKYYRRTGAVIGLDREKTKEFLEEEKARLAAAAGQALDRGGARAREALTGAKETLTRKLSELEAWFSARKLSLPTSKDLALRAKDLARKLSGPGDRSSASPPPAAAKGDGSSAVAAPGAGAGEPAAEPPPARSEPRGADPLSRGREEFRLGLEHWKAAGEPGSPREQEELAAARRHFTAAQELLEQASRERPGDSVLESLQTDCNRFLYDCMKRTKLELED